MKKTIAYLNSTAWYRLLKVIYLLALVALMAGFNASLILEVGVKNVDQDKTRINCLHKDKKTFSPNDIGRRLDKKDFNTDGGFDYEHFYEGYNEDLIRDILEQCYEKEVEDVYAMQKYYELGLHERGVQDIISKSEMQQVVEIQNNSLTSAKVRDLNYNFKFFDIDPVHGVSLFLKIFIWGNLAILISLELIRRIFYYVVLGKLFPVKKEKE